MEYTHLGRSGLSVSRLCLGTMNFGPVVPEVEAHQLMDAALGHGINFFDTADIYGWELGKGFTETILGNWFRLGGSRREQTVLATKLYGSMHDWPNNDRLSALHIRRACDASLRRLQTDYIDLYQMHHIDRTTPWDEIWEAMEVLRVQGKILYVGSSNFAGWHLAQGQEAARSRHSMGLISEQTHYNLTERTAELEVLPACQAYGLGLLPWSPLASGRLGGVLQKQALGESRRSARGRSPQIVETGRAAFEAWESLCAERRTEPAAMALAWLLRQPAVTAPVIGPRSLRQLEGALAALAVPLDEDALARIDQIFPGPGGTAPEAYAW